MDFDANVLGNTANRVGQMPAFNVPQPIDRSGLYQPQLKLIEEEAAIKAADQKRTANTAGSISELAKADPHALQIPIVEQEYDNFTAEVNKLQEMRKGRNLKDIYEDPDYLAQEHKVRNLPKLVASKIAAVKKNIDLSVTADAEITKKGDGLYTEQQTRFKEALKDFAEAQAETDPEIRKRKVYEASMKISKIASNSPLQQIEQKQFTDAMDHVKKNLGSTTEETILDGLTKDGKIQGLSPTSTANDVMSYLTTKSSVHQVNSIVQGNAAVKEGVRLLTQDPQYKLKNAYSFFNQNGFENAVEYVNFLKERTGSIPTNVNSHALAEKLIDRMGTSEGGVYGALKALLGDKFTPDGVNKSAFFLPNGREFEYQTNATGNVIDVPGNTLRQGKDGNFYIVDDKGKMTDKQSEPALSNKRIDPYKQWTMENVAMDIEPMLSTVYKRTDAANVSRVAVPKTIINNNIGPSGALKDVGSNLFATLTQPYAPRYENVNYKSKDGTVIGSGTTLINKWSDPVLTEVFDSYMENRGIQDILSNARDITGEPLKNQRLSKEEMNDVKILSKNSKEVYHLPVRAGTNGDQFVVTSPMDLDGEKGCAAEFYVDPKTNKAKINTLFDVNGNPIKDWKTTYKDLAETSFYFETNKSVDEKKQGSNTLFDLNDYNTNGLGKTGFINVKGTADTAKIKELERLIAKNPDSPIFKKEREQLKALKEVSAATTYRDDTDGGIWINAGQNVLETNGSFKIQTGGKYKLYPSESVLLLRPYLKAKVGSTNEDLLPGVKDRAWYNDKEAELAGKETIDGVDYHTEDVYYPIDPSAVAHLTSTFVGKTGQESKQLVELYSSNITTNAFDKNGQLYKLKFNNRSPLQTPQQ